MTTKKPYHLRLYEIENKGFYTSTIEIDFKAGV